MSDLDAHISNHHLSLDEALAWLRSQGVHPLQAIKTIRRCYGLDLARAKLALMEHPAWQQEADVMRQFDEAANDVLKGRR